MRFAFDSAQLRGRSYKNRLHRLVRDSFIAATHGQRHSNLLVRQPAGMPRHPRWEARPVGLEELVLAYLDSAGPAAEGEDPRWSG